MTPFRSHARTAADTPRPANMPEGYDDPEHRMFVPDELRPYYTIDTATEMTLWEYGPGGPGRSGPTGTPYRYVAAVEIYRATRTEVDGKPWVLDGRDAREGKILESAAEQIAATLGDADRDAFMHPGRIETAWKALASERDRQGRHDAQYQLTVCDACHESTTTTRNAWLLPAAGLIVLTHAGRPGPGGLNPGVMVGARLCHPCAGAVQLEAQRRAAAQTLLDGTTRTDAAAAWLDAHA